MTVTGLPHKISDRPRLQAATGHNKAVLLQRIEDAALKISFLQSKLASCIAAHPPIINTPYSHTLTLDIAQVVDLANGILSAFRLRLHNLGSGDHRHSTFDIARRISLDVYESLDGFPKDLGQLSSTTDYYFNDIKSTSIALENLAPTAWPVRLEVIFETNDTEIIVNNWFDRDLTAFSISLDLDIVADASHESLAIVASNPSTKAVVGHWYGDSEDSGIEDAFNSKITEQFSQASLLVGRALTEYFITTDKSRFDYSILKVTQDGSNWVINYTQRPKIGGVGGFNQPIEALQ